MAAVNTETAAYNISTNNGAGNSAGAVMRVSGTFATSGGSTSGVIIPGYDGNTGDVLLTEGSLNKCRGIRKILNWSLTNNANSNAFKVVKTYDTTADADKLTVTCTANDTFDYVIEGIDIGQNV